MENTLLIPILLLAAGILLPVILYFRYPETVRAILHDLRVLRILHYVLLAGLGASLCLKEPVASEGIPVVSLLIRFSLFIITLVYAAVFAIVSNNMADEEGDKLTNPHRPLFASGINRKRYLNAGIFSLLIALVIAGLTEWIIFYCIAFISTVYFLYSCKPFRLKRIPFVYKFLIGINSLAVPVCGYALAGVTPVQFPLIWALFILFPLTLAANFVDLKDTEGDRSMGIRTFPVIFGEYKARIIIALCTLVAYGMAGILLNLYWLYPLNGLMAVLHIHLLFRKPYREKPVFLIYLSSLLALNVILFFHRFFN